ncbi:MAG: hypothetical protein WKG01_08195 [Kofleriaceae bacterium]
MTATLVDTRGATGAGAGAAAGATMTVGDGQQHRPRPQPPCTAARSGVPTEENDENEEVDDDSEEVVDMMSWLGAADVPRACRL